jgi:flagellar protein FlgJ
MRVPGSLAADGRSLDALKTDASKDPKGAVRQAATQFEALFMQMVLKSMRDSVPKSGMLEGSGAEVYQGMLDTQFAQAMTGRPGGLSELIAKQLMRAMKRDDGDADAAAAATGGAASASVGTAGIPGLAFGATAPGVASAARDRAAREANTVPPAAAPSIGGTAASTDPTPGTRAAATPGVRAFVDRMWGAAAQAERSTGVPAGFIVGQAALESGWGRQELRHADGRPAHNLFGIKAGPAWQGATVEATTTEWLDGRPVKTVERFRAYDSYEAAFDDWARLMVQSPRYAGVVQAGGSIESFARNLQRAGYATDPDYASKLTRVITQALGARREST